MERQDCTCDSHMYMQFSFMLYPLYSMNGYAVADLGICKGGFQYRAAGPFRHHKRAR